MKELTKFTLTIGLVFVIYGYGSRLFEIYFFWESKSIGWSIIFLGLIGLLLDRIRFKKNQKKKSIFEKIGIGLLIFTLFLQLIQVSVIPFTDAFATTKNYLNSNQEIIDEIGQIEGFSLMTLGSYHSGSNSEGTYGSAKIYITVKGQKKFTDLIIFVSKNIDQPAWTVDEIYN